MRHFLRRPSLAGRPCRDLAERDRARQGVAEEQHRVHRNADVHVDVQPQPYGEIFVMRFDGTDVRLTDNQWEKGTPAWRPSPRATAAR
jgi:hypothetical protein